jgi:predicted CoA-binding protein
MSDPVSTRLSLPDPLIAVVGATDTPGKYGGIIYRDLKRKGYRVAAINPRRTTVDGDPTYPSVSAMDETPDIVNIVVPPRFTLKTLDEVAALPDPVVWIQPGAADEDVRRRVEELRIPALIDACIMVESRSRV